MSVTKSVDWILVVDRVNEKILRILEWRDEINMSLKSTNVFIDGIIGMIISYAEYEKSSQDIKEYKYSLFGELVGIRFFIFGGPDDFSLGYSSFIGLSIVNNSLQYSSDGRVTTYIWLDKIEMTTENISTLFLTCHQYELENRVFSFEKWNNCQNVFNCDEYFTIQH